MLVGAVRGGVGVGCVQGQVFSAILKKWQTQSLYLQLSWPMILSRLGGIAVAGC